MKPHRAKHLRKKAARQLSLTDVKAAKIAENRARRAEKSNFMPIILDQYQAVENFLKPIDQNKAKEMLDYFVKHWKREKIVHLKSFHRNKRTTPGEVEGEGPYTDFGHNPNEMQQKWVATNLEKSHKVARDILKYQNQHHKKAA